MDIIKSYNGTEIHITAETQMNLTEMWRAAGSDPNKKVSQWSRTQTAQEFIHSVREKLKDADLHLSVYETRPGANGGTWGHWQVALAYAHFLDPLFYQWCNEIVMEQLSGRQAAETFAPTSEAERKLREAKLRVDGLAAQNEMLSKFSGMLRKGIQMNKLDEEKAFLLYGEAFEQITGLSVFTVPNRSFEMAQPSVTKEDIRQEVKQGVAEAMKDAVRTGAGAGVGVSVDGATVIPQDKTAPLSGDAIAKHYSQVLGVVISASFACRVGEALGLCGDKRYGKYNTMGDAHHGVMKKNWRYFEDAKPLFAAAFQGYKNLIDQEQGLRSSDKSTRTELQAQIVKGLQKIGEGSTPTVISSDRIEPNLN